MTDQEKAAYIIARLSIVTQNHHRGETPVHSTDEHYGLDTVEGNLAKCTRDLLAPIAAGTHVIVPKDVTQAMKEAGEIGWCAAQIRMLPERAADCYRAMIKSAGGENEITR